MQTVEQFHRDRRYAQTRSTVREIYSWIGFGSVIAALIVFIASSIIF